MPTPYTRYHLLALKIPLRESNYGNQNDYTLYNDFVVISRTVKDFDVNIGGNTNFNYFSFGI
nr:MAG TPA: hypothetical protein [Caudoviricetes sp.]